jgi:hypothetical protein
VTRRFAFILSLTLLLGMTLGCGLSGIGRETPPPAEAPSGDEEAPSPTEAPSGGEVAEPVGGEAETEEEEISLSSVTSGLQSLDSYRSHFAVTFEDITGGEAEHGVYEMDMEYTRDPLAQRIVIHGDDTGQSFEIVRIGDRQYVVFEEGQCVSSSAAESDAMDTEIFKPDDIVGGLEKARRVRPDERVNGILCQHYVFDETNIAWAGFTRAKGEVWIAVEGDYVVKHALQADGRNPVTGDDEGHIEWEYEIRDVNAPIAIEPPAGCEGTESEFPIMPDATDMTTMSGMVTYTSASSFDDVLAFYQKQMPADGWDDTGDPFISPGNAMLSYAKEGRTATITLSGEDGSVSVLIMGE